MRGRYGDELSIVHSERLCPEDAKRMSLSEFFFLTKKRKEIIFFEATYAPASSAPHLQPIWSSRTWRSSSDTSLHVQRAEVKKKKAIQSQFWGNKSSDVCHCVGKQRGTKDDISSGEARALCLPFFGIFFIVKSIVRVSTKIILSTAVIGI